MCVHCDEAREPYYPPNPIFTALSLEYQKDRKHLPWIVAFKPSGTISQLNATSSGIHPIFSGRYDRVTW